MGRFNPTTYDPRTESSPGHERDGLLVLSAADGLCNCGCGGEVAGKKSLFKMGHDARLRGKLIRAHLAGVQVAYGSTEPSAAIDVAAGFDNANFSWTEALKAADSKQGADVRAKLGRANRELVERATGPQVGDRRLIKVGRWEYTGQVAAVFAVDGEVEIEYVTKSGETRTVRQPAEVKG